MKKSTLFLSLFLCLPFAAASCSDDASASDAKEAVEDAADDAADAVEDAADDAADAVDGK